MGYDLKIKLVVKHLKKKNNFFSAFFRFSKMIEQILFKPKEK